jgi:competence protein ComEA
MFCSGINSRISKKSSRRGMTMKKFSFTLFLALFWAAAAFAAVNINSAGKEALTSLPGIGPARAEAIIQYREAKGPFKDVASIKNVKGIGEKLFEKIKKDITVGEAAPADTASNAQPEGQEAVKADSEK